MMKKQFGHANSAISSLKSNYYNNDAKSMIYNNQGYWEMLKHFDPELKPGDIADVNERQAH